MQLLIILALLLYGGKSGAQNILSEVKPVLESIGGDNMKQALKSAEEISTVLSAVQSFTQQSSKTDAFSAFAPSFGGSAPQESKSDVNFPLSPVSAIADRDITYSLSQYIAQN